MALLYSYRFVYIVYIITLLQLLDYHLSWQDRKDKAFHMIIFYKKSVNKFRICAHHTHTHAYIHSHTPMHTHIHNTQKRFVQSNKIASQVEEQARVDRVKKQEGRRAKEICTEKWKTNVSLIGLLCCIVESKQNSHFWQSWIVFTKGLMQSKACIFAKKRHTLFHWVMKKTPICHFAKCQTDTGSKNQAHWWNILMDDSWLQWTWHWECHGSVTVYAFHNNNHDKDRKRPVFTDLSKQPGKNNCKNSLYST